MSYKNISSVSPYFDDFDSSKEFYAMLFNPSRAVQARELTQIQTILQNQISSMGNHLFKDNSIIVNANVEHSTDKNVIQIDDDAINNPASQTLSTSFVGKIVTDGTTTAKITHVDQDNFLIYFNYVSGPGYDDTSPIPLQGPLGTSDDLINTVIGTKSFATTASCSAGVVYTGGYFVIVNQQESIVDSDISGHYHIGFIRSESALSINEDISLGDPANGTNNASSPGADRYKISLVLSSYIEGQAIPDNFVEFLVIDNGEIVKATTKVEYADILDLLARRTYDESGNYIINNFDLILEDHDTDDTKLSVNMQPGKAYVLGYEIDKDLSSTLDIDKSRETRTQNADAVFTDWGQYLIIAQIDGDTSADNAFDMQTAGTAILPNFSGGIQMSVRNVKDGALSGEIGLVRSVGLKRVGDELRLYITDLDDVIGSIGESQSVTTGTGADFWYANLHRPKGYTEIKGKATGPILEFSSYEAIQSLSDISYEYSKTFNGIATDGAGQLAISGSAFDSFGGSESIIAVVERASGKTFYTDFTVSGAGTSSITIDRTPILTPSSTFDVVLLINKTQLTPRTKSIISDFEETIVIDSSSATATDINILTKEDILSIKKIYQSDNFINASINDAAYDPAKIINYNSSDVYDVTDEFFFAGEFRNGQTDVYYGPGTLKGMFTESLKVLTGVANNTSYFIIYDYYIHSNPSGGKGFTAASYPDYDLIGNYQSDTAPLINLTNSIDFRYKLTEIANTPEYPYQSTQLLADITYYLSRIDKVYLDKEGKFAIKKGISSVNPIAPNDINNAITLYSVNLPAYTYNRNKVFIKRIDHKRYTMRDIGDIDSRLSAIEEYTSLTLLEKSAAELSIKDANGFDMFKAGIFADAMNSYDNHNTEDPEYNLVVDVEKGFGRGPFDVDFIEFTDTGAGTSSNINNGENTITLSFTENAIPLAQNTAVTDFVNVNPLLFHQWNGTIKLSPSVDQWIDVTQKPTIINDRTISPARPPTRLVTIGWNGEFNWWRNRWFGNRRATDIPAVGVSLGGPRLNRSFASPSDMIPAKIRLN